MRISHRNCLQSYLSDWRMIMEAKARAEGRPSSGLRGPQPSQSLARHEFNLCIMLELLDERLTRVVMTLESEDVDSDYGAWSEALAFFDAIYLFSRMLLDSAAGIVRHRDLNKSHGDCELPKSFNDMYKKSLKGELPTNLNTVFAQCQSWFPQLKDRRDAIVHDYESYLIGFGDNSVGGRTAVQFSPRERSAVMRPEALHSHIGMVMAGYQSFVDRLLDYWDEALGRWYGICRSASSCTRSILAGRSANILWWAYQYGGYRHDNMVVSES